MYFADSNGVYVCLPFAEFVWQKHGFGSRQANPTADLILRQVHSNLVRNAENLADREEGDALVSNQLDRWIAVRTADCVPILLLDSRTRAVGAIHAGWRGTAARIAIQTIHKLTADFDTDPTDVFAAIGPCIRPCCYEVSPDVAAQFGAWPESVYGATDPKPRIDLSAANRTQLLEGGIRPAHIFDSEICTACQLDRFFSYRREPASPGRMLSAIVRIA